jgi:8-oxo-dGTP diphosphatase
MYQKIIQINSISGLKVVKEEYLDVLDPITLKSMGKKSRTAIHHDGDLHGVVHVFIYVKSPRKGLIFTMNSPRKYPDLNPVRKWAASSTVGHISSGESVLAAALREPEEELGLSKALGRPLTKDDLEYLFFIPNLKTNKEIGLINNEIDHVFLLVLERLDLATLELQKEEVEIADIITVDEFRKHVKNKNGRFSYREKEYTRLLNVLRAKGLT